MEVGERGSLYTYHYTVTTRITHEDKTHVRNKYTHSERYRGAGAGWVEGGWRGKGGGEKGEGNELVFNLKVQRKREEGEHERLETGNGGNGGGGGGGEI